MSTHYVETLHRHPMSEAYVNMLVLSVGNHVYTYVGTLGRNRSTLCRHPMSEPYIGTLCGHPYLASYFGTPCRHPMSAPYIDRHSMRSAPYVGTFSRYFRSAFYAIGTLCWHFQSVLSVGTLGRHSWSALSVGTIGILREAVYYPSRFVLFVYKL